MIATKIGRRQTGTHITFFYCGLWVHRIGSYCYPDGRRFIDCYFSRKDLVKEYSANAEDFWFRHYRPQEGDVILDVGAGRGEDTLVFSKAVKKSGRVVSIEADPVSFKFLEYLCRLNNLTNTTPIQVAAMDKPGMVSLVASENWLANMVVPKAKGLHGSDVAAATLDEICDRMALRKINFLKMNIEGAERYALLGMKSVLPCIQTLCVACHDFLADRGCGEHFRTRAFVERFLVEHGFKVAGRPDDPRDFVRDHVFGWRN
jgi:FkbM family methyltransferase